MSQDIHLTSEEKRKTKRNPRTTTTAASLLPAALLDFGGSGFEDDVVVLLFARGRPHLVVVVVVQIPKTPRTTDGVGRGRHLTFDDDVGRGRGAEVGFAERDFAVELGHHAAGRGEEDAVRDAVDDDGAVAEGVAEEGEEPAHAREQLEAVVEAN